MSEVQKFFDDLKDESNLPADIFGVTSPEAKADEIPAKDEDEPRKNRKHRRIEQQLEAERQSAMQMANLIKEQAEELRKAKAGSISADMPSEWQDLYGDTPESQKAWRLQQKMLSDHTERVRSETREQFKAEQESAKAAQLEAEKLIDSELENLEDTYNVDLTSDAPAARKARKEYLELVQKLSPQDKAGNIIGYADFEATFEMYQKNKDKPEPSRNKEIAGKTMERSAPTTGSKRPTAGFYGWQKDFGL